MAQLCASQALKHLDVHSGNNSSSLFIILNSISSTGQWEDGGSLKYSCFCSSYSTEKKNLFQCSCEQYFLLCSLSPNIWMKKSYLFWIYIYIYISSVIADLYIINREFRLEEYFLKIQIAQLSFIPSLIPFFFYVATVCVHNVKVRLLWKLLIIFQ